jgi:Domain of unknown function (DUF4381)
MEPSKLPLRDLHLPPAIGWWPPAPGWWVLAVLVPLLICLGYWAYRRITRKTAFKAAIKLLSDIKLDTQRDNRQKIREISILLRRMALTVDSGRDCAALTGARWLAFLDQTLPSNNNPPLFSQGIGGLLADLPYRRQAPSDDDISQLIALCERWLKAQKKRKA